MKGNAILGGIEGIGTAGGAVAPVPDIAGGDASNTLLVLTAGGQALAHAGCRAVGWGGKDPQSGVDRQEGSGGDQIRVVVETCQVGGVKGGREANNVWQGDIVQNCEAARGVGGVGCQHIEEQVVHQRRQLVPPTRVGAARACG